MTKDWIPQETSTHQDHVIAHLLGATFLGYFVFEEALYVLLDIGFIWTIFLNGEMGLLPHPVAISELEIDSERKEQIREDIDLLLNDGASESLQRLHPPPVHSQIKEVSLFAEGERTRLLITGEETGIAIEMSSMTAEISVIAKVMSSE